MPNSSASTRFLAVFTVTGPNRDGQLRVLSESVAEWNGNIVESHGYVLGDESCVAAYISFRDELSIRNAASACLTLQTRIEFRGCYITFQRTAEKYERLRDRHVTGILSVSSLNDTPGLLATIGAAIQECGMSIVGYRGYQAYDKADITPIYKGYFRVVSKKYPNEITKEQKMEVIRSLNANGLVASFEDQ